MCPLVFDPLGATRRVDAGGHRWPDCGCSAASCWAASSALKGLSHRLDGVQGVAGGGWIAGQVGHARAQAVGLAVQGSGAGVAAHQAVAKGREGHGREDIAGGLTS